MDKIENLLAKRINKAGLSKPIEAARIVSCANEISQGRFAAIKFNRGVLTIRCSTSEEAHQIFVEQNKIISQINTKLAKPCISKLAFRIGKV